MEAVILVGVQGAGKTAFYRERFLTTHTRINLDTLRTRRREEQLLAECLQAGRPFVVDNTNILSIDRARYIGPARNADFRIVAYWFQVPLQEAIRRNNQRMGKEKVPVAALVSAFKKMVPPAREEGFDEIHTVSLGADGRFIVS